MHNITPEISISELASIEIISAKSLENSKLDLMFNLELFLTVNKARSYSPLPNLVNCLCVKSSDLFSNNYVWYTVLFMIAVQLVLIYTPLSEVFGIVSLTGKEWLLVLAASIPGLVVFETSKFVKQKINSQK